ncbi:hypothetical protein NP493_560g01058 [Ridgeia piscesae]|uniref:Uncharacterized protein n=1 Tax=Ridgeia piscesae TaxID=27915 RepID=A0AAD9KVH8_RIDPI|nr:hypothetical protein NP493_560g01058 [Ridgeia piscesae]
MDVATLSTVLDSALKSMQAEGCSLRNFRLERGARCTTILIEFVHIANQTWFEVSDGGDTERSLKVCHCGKSLSSSRETVSDKVAVDGSDNMSLTSYDSQAVQVVPPVMTCDTEQKAPVQVVPPVVTCDTEQKAPVQVVPPVVTCDTEQKAPSNGRNSVDKGCNTDSDPDSLSIVSETKSANETSPARVITPNVNLHTMNTKPSQMTSEDIPQPLGNGKPVKELTPTVEVVQSPGYVKPAKEMTPTATEAQSPCNGKPAKEKTPSIGEAPITYIDQQDSDAEKNLREGYTKSKGRSMSTTSDSSMLNQEEMKRQQDRRKSKPRSLSITIDELQNRESMQLKDDGKAKQHSPLLKPNKNVVEPASPKNNSHKPLKQTTSNSKKTKENRPPAGKPPMPGPKPVAPPVEPPATEADNDESDEDEDVLISQVVKKWSAIRGKKGLF